MAELFRTFYQARLAELQALKTQKLEEEAWLRAIICPVG
jgi:hypothetical protein